MFITFLRTPCEYIFVACFKLKNTCISETEGNDFIHYDDKAIDALLDRSKEGVEAKEKENSQINEYLSSFKVATYKYSDKHVEVNRLTLLSNFA